MLHVDMAESRGDGLVRREVPLRIIPARSTMEQSLQVGDRGS